MFKKIWKIALLLSLSTSVVFAEDTDEDFLSGAEYSAKIGNYSEGEYYREPSEIFLQQNDALFLTLHSALVEKDLFIENKAYLESMGLNTENALNSDIYSENGENVMKNFLTILSEFYILILTAIVAMFSTVAMLQYKKDELNSKMMMKLSGMFLVISSITFVISDPTKVIASYVGLYNYVGAKSHDAETINEMHNSSIKKFSNIFETNNANFVNALMTMQSQEDSTKLSIIKQNYGSASTLTYDLKKSYRDDRDPYVFEYLDFLKSCLRNNRVEVDTDWVFTFTKWNILDAAVIPHTASYIAGGDVYNYDCEQEFGQRDAIALLTIKNETPNVNQRFFEEKYALNMSKDTSSSDDIKKMFNSQLGYANDQLEKASDLAKTERVKLPENYKLALQAIIDSDEQNISIKDTKAFKTLQKSNEEALSKITEYEKQEGLSVDELTYLQAVRLPHYKFSLINGYCNQLDPVTNECKFGYNFIEEELQKTVVKMRDLNCALNNAKFFDKRVEQQERWNALDLKKLKNVKAGSISGQHPIECFDYDFDKKEIKALGNELNIEELKTEINQRTRAFIVMFNAIDEAFFEVSKANEKQTKEKRKEFLNKIKPDFYNSVSLRNDYITDLDKQQRIFNALESTLSFEISNKVEVEKPSIYFDYNRFARNVVDEDYIDRTNLERTLTYKDYSFALNGLTIRDKKALEKREKELNELGFGDDSPFLTPFTCPLINKEGFCVASLSELNHANVKNTAEMAAIVIFGRASISALSGTCQAGSQGQDALNVLSKVTPLGAIKSVLSTIGCKTAIVVESGFKEILDAVSVGMIMLLILQYLAKYVIFIAMITFCFQIIIQVLVPFFFFYIVLGFDIIKGFSVYALSGFQNDNALLNFEGTKKMVLEAIVSPLIAITSFIMLNWLLISPSVGGLFYTIMRSIFEENMSTFSYILFGLLMNFIIAMILIKSLSWVSSYESVIKRMFGMENTETLAQGSAGMLGITTAYLASKGHSYVDNKQSQLSSRVSQTALKDRQKQLEEMRQRKMDDEKGDEKQESKNE